MAESSTELRAAWDAHPNREGPTSTLLLVHDQFRVTAERLVLMTGRGGPDWVGRQFAPLVQTIHHHDHAEEALIFPMVHQRTGAVTDALVADHRALTNAMDVVEECLADGSDRGRLETAITTFSKTLSDHLDREEALVIPVLLEMKADEAWALIFPR